MGIDRQILQKALNSTDTDLRNLNQAESIQNMALDSSNFGGGQAGRIGLASQLGTAAFGAYAKYKTQKSMQEKELAAQQAFSSKYPQYADLASQLSPTTREAFILKDISQQAGFGTDSDPAQVREYNYYNKLSPDQQKEYLTLKRVDPVAAAYGKKQADLQFAGNIEAEKIRGKDLGENINLLESMESKMPQLERTVADLSRLGKKATYTIGGQIIDQVLKQSGLPTRESAIARREYITKVRSEVLPLLRDTFGAAFTKAEGDSLIETLGDPNASPEEKDAIVRSFIDSKRQRMYSLQRRTGRSTTEQNITENKPSLDEIFK